MTVVRGLGTTIRIIRNPNFPYGQNCGYSYKTMITLTQSVNEKMSPLEVKTFGVKQVSPSAQRKDLE